MPSLQELIAARAAKAPIIEETQPVDEVTQPPEEPVEEPSQEIPDNPLAEANTGDAELLSAKVKREMAKADTEGQDKFGLKEPGLDAEPMEWTRYHLDVLNATLEANMTPRDALIDVHRQLKDNPDTKQLLMPEDMQGITLAMLRLTQRAHVTKQKAKTERIEKKVTKEKETDAIVSELAEFF